LTGSFFFVPGPMRKRALPPLVALSVFALLAAAETSLPPKYLEPAAFGTANALVQSIQGSLPPGWTASLERETSWIQVARMAPVLSTSTAPNVNPFEPPQPREFWFAFRVMPHLSDAEHRRRHMQNLTLAREASAIHDELVRRRVSRKFDSFLPQTDEERQLATNYERLKSAAHVLPTHHYRDIGLELYEPTVSANNERESRECRAVYEKTLRLLKKYRDE
jgi:hypothetical protein